LDWIDANKSGGLIAVAFPGFNDIYKQAGVHDSYGRIDSRDGATFSETLDRALKSNAKIVQIATWNDYGEGTGIEPGLDNGYRSIDHLQKTLQPASFTAADLRLPAELYRLRKRGGNAGDLDQAAASLFAGKTNEATGLIAKVKAKVEDGAAAFLETPAVSDPDYHLETDRFYRKGEGATEAMKLRCRLDVYYPVNKGKFATVVWFHGVD